MCGSGHNDSYKGQWLWELTRKLFTLASTLDAAKLRPRERALESGGSSICMNSDFNKLFKNWLLLSLGVTIAAHTASGISYESVPALIVAVLLLSACNLVLKPILMFFSLPFIILTFGVGIWLINALLFLLVGTLVQGFEVASFGNALWGAFVVSLTGVLASLLFGGPAVRIRSETVDDRSSGSGPRSHKAGNEDDDVIDI